MRTEAEIALTVRQALECYQTPEAGRGKEWVPLHGPWSKLVLVDFELLASRTVNE